MAVSAIRIASYFLTVTVTLRTLTSLSHFTFTDAPSLPTSSLRPSLYARVRSRVADHFELGRVQDVQLPFDGLALHLLVDHQHAGVRVHTHLMVPLTTDFSRPCRRPPGEAKTPTTSNAHAAVRIMVHSLQGFRPTHGRPVPLTGRSNRAWSVSVGHGRPPRRESSGIALCRPAGYLHSPFPSRTTDTRTSLRLTRKEPTAWPSTHP